MPPKKSPSPETLMFSPTPSPEIFYIDEKPKRKGGRGQSAGGAELIKGSDVTPYFSQAGAKQEARNLVGIFRENMRRLGDNPLNPLIAPKLSNSQKELITRMPSISRMSPTTAAETEFRAIRSKADRQRIINKRMGGSEKVQGDISQFKKGGMVKKTGLALVHKGEVVVPANKVASVDKALKKAGMKPLKK